VGKKKKRKLSACRGEGSVVVGLQLRVDSDHTKRAHSGPKLRFGPAATACAKAPRQPVEGCI